MSRAGHSQVLFPLPRPETNSTQFLFNVHNHPKKLLLLSPFHRGANLGLQGYKKCSRSASSGTVEIQTHTCLSPCIFYRLLEARLIWFSFSLTGSPVGKPSLSCAHGLPSSDAVSPQQWVQIGLILSTHLAFRCKTWVSSQSLFGMVSYKCAG